MKTPGIAEIDQIDLTQVPNQSITKLKLKMVPNALGEYWRVPVMIAKGKAPGPVLGVAAALHGNELNGLPIIHKLLNAIDINELSGTIIAVPVLNVPGFLNGEREFNDGKDLNRLMPGKLHGSSSEIYAHSIVEKIVKHFDYFVDLHTASFGRMNSLYVRADMNDPVVARMAELQHPQIIVNIPGGEGTLRRSAAQLGIPTITVEVGDPHRFQKKHIYPSTFGVLNLLRDLDMLPKDSEDKSEGEAPLICRSSFWIYAKSGGILEVYPGLTDLIYEGQAIAKISNVFGDLIEEVLAPEEGIVVAKSTNPVCQAGSRIMHVGLLWQDYKKR